MLQRTNIIMYRQDVFNTSSYRFIPDVETLFFYRNPMWLSLDGQVFGVGWNRLLSLQLILWLNINHSVTFIT